MDLHKARLRPNTNKKQILTLKTNNYNEENVNYSKLEACLRVIITPTLGNVKNYYYSQLLCLLFLTVVITPTLVDE